MTVRAMSIEELEEVLGWAADEGWNPGLDDAKAFYAADPAGFLVKEVQNEIVAAISVVNHDPDFAFLGLYLCKPQYRGQGHGIDVWHAGIAHAGSRSIGLDGVPDQQENYARSGFVKCGSTVRYEGRNALEPAPNVRLANPNDLQFVINSDMKTCGMQRDAFATAWFTQTPSRQTIVLGDGKDVKGFATFRRCGAGIKIGPISACSDIDARVLLENCPFIVPNCLYYVDVQGHDSALAKLLLKLGFEPVFETARMFRGIPPATVPVAFHAIATMELG